MLLGARQFFSIKKGAVPMTQITLTQNCTNCQALANHIALLCTAEGISNAMCSVVANEPRANLVGIVPIINGVRTSSVLRYRNGKWTDALTTTADYDADARIGDVYNVYVPDGLWN